MFERQGACTSVATESSVADTCSHATPRCQSCTPLLAASSAFIPGKNRDIRYICLSTSPFYNYSGSTYNYVLLFETKCWDSAAAAAAGAEIDVAEIDVAGAW